jgi:hypothetical protein
MKPNLLRELFARRQKMQFGVQYLVEVTLYSSDRTIKETGGEC